MKILPPLVLAALAALLAPSAVAQNATTTPVGAMTVTIDASSNGTSYKVTPFSTPLLAVSVPSGNPAGKIASVSAASISDDSGGWVASDLLSEPHYLRILSGAAQGRMFLISANTSTALTLTTQGVDLTTLGIQSGSSGDSYQIVKGFTLLGLLGTPSSPVGGVLGGTSGQFSAGQTDKVLINDSTGVARSYYYDTTVSQWRRIGSATNQGSLPISPLAGLVYYRVPATSIALDFIGEVPATQLVRLLPTTGTTIISPYFPATTTLAALGLHGLSGWRKLGDSGVVLNSTDRALIKDGSGVIRSFYHDGTSWKRVGSASNQDTTPVTEGSCILITRFGAIGEYTVWAQLPPYSL